MDFPVTEAQTKHPRMKGAQSLIPLTFRQKIFDILHSVQIIYRNSEKVCTWKIFILQQKYENILNE